MTIYKGYLMVDFDGRKKFNREKKYRIYGKNHTGHITFDGHFSFNEIEDIYLENKAVIDSFAQTNLHVDFNNPTFHDLLCIASDIMDYNDCFGR